ncbi:leucyl aminopeptidase [Corynebacterium appendicis CIP 107643]|uniref:Probable cytosol aminopeptidase n=1 Tax=Corynebacterium appendicis CIP 107643 TaxID=1161099 RepID=A0A1N7J028_9CORY|nr:leucyl aminopeptidase [Corynebacterium appendicis]WJY61526.1 Cytosol aminopeptidase [Corynebacterium appendicis CIP 107643]SIS42713.1 leucyl aminopeptidase [Corynebacterium appendicis CIP 107643]
MLPHTTGVLPSHGTLPSVDFAAHADSTLVDGAARLIPIVQGEALELPVSALTRDGLLEALEAVGAKGSHGEIVKVALEGVLYIAVGLGEDTSATSVRRAMGAAARALKGVDRVVVSGEFGVGAIVEGLLLGGYTYSGLKSEDSGDGEADGQTDERPSAPQITVIGRDDERAEFEAAATTGHAVALARDLVNTPSNLLYPEVYASYAEKIATNAGLTVDILDETQLREQGFGGITAVGQGSAHPPRLVHLTWAPENASAETSIALVGKGITFDSGGVSLKPANGMEQMVMDMGGSAAVLATSCAVAALDIPVHLEAWMPMAENMPSGSAQRPGDVITHYGGITSEIINTDAEGRLVLADAIARACEDSPSHLIETSTLTGAQMVALGKRTFGVMGSDELRDRIAENGRELDEPGWAMPLLEEHEEEISSKVADVKNANSDRFGGMEFAATYLSRFIGEDTEWAHVDIASPAWNSGAPHGFTPGRATGVPVRTLVETIRGLV